MSRFEALALPAALSLVVGCSAPIVAPSPSAELDRPGAPWPSGVPRCVIRGAGVGDLCDGRLEVGAAGEPLVAYNLFRAREVTWSDFPLLGAERRTGIAVAGDLRLEGVARLEGHIFVLSSPLELRGGVIRAPRGTPVEILGTSGAEVALSIPTPLTSPRRFEALVDCAQLSFSKVTPAGVGPRPDDEAPLLEPVEDGLIPLFGRDERTPRLLLKVRPGVLREVERHGERIRVRAGASVGVVSVEEATALIDGWVPAASVRRVGELVPDSDSGCGILDSVDECPCPLLVTTSATALRAGREAPGEVIGEVAPGVELIEVHRAAGLVAVRPLDLSITALPGHQLFVAAQAVTPTDEPSNEFVRTDGCPPCNGTGEPPSPE